MKAEFWRRISKKFGGIFDLDRKKQRLIDIDQMIEANPKFWDDPKSSSATLKEKKGLESLVERCQNLNEKFNDLHAALELSGEGDEFLAEADGLRAWIAKELEELETQSLLSGEMDSCSALISLNAGAGGTESCDWAAMLFRMYTRFAEKKGWSVSIHDLQDGDEAGLKSASFEVSGDFAFGLLKAESGVHRLVRISPFDSNARRHTSFASVYVNAVVEDDIEVSIDPNDLRIDTYRASGAGGQHVNRTDSAVRITHGPSQVVVQCQSQRSQHQNKDTAMKMLRSRLYEIELKERQKAQQSLEESKSEIGFGSQIRSYVLHPYKMVKDHRTNLESHSPSDVLDGEIASFITSFLQQTHSN